MPVNSPLVAASIWFEIWGIWGVVHPRKHISTFPGKFPKNYNISGNFTKKFRFFQTNFRKISIFQAIKKIRISMQKLAIYSHFLANYSVSIQKSPVSNIPPVHDKI